MAEKQHKRPDRTSGGISARGAKAQRSPRLERENSRQATTRKASAPAVTGGPSLPVAVQAELLDKATLKELSALPEGLAQRVGRHLAAAGLALEEDPERAYEHAAFARELAPRVACVREAAAVASYRTARYTEALAEFRALRRMTGSLDSLPVLADIERALGRPQRALELAGSPEVDRLDAVGRLEMRIVAAGARLDLDQPEAALLTLQVPQLRYAPKSGGETSAATADAASDMRQAVARLRYAYAEALLANSRDHEALEWFTLAEEYDQEGQTDADERIDELTLRLAGVQGSPDPTER